MTIHFLTRDLPLEPGDEVVSVTDHMGTLVIVTKQGTVIQVQPDRG